MRTRKQKTRRRARTYKQRGGEKGEIGAECTKGRIYGDTCKDGIGCLFIDISGKGKCSPYKADQYSRYFIKMIREGNVKGFLHLISLDPKLLKKKYGPLEKSPLMIASETNNTDIINYLINQGADITEQNKDYHETALLIACQNGQTNNVTALITPKRSLNLGGKLKKTINLPDKDFNFPLTIAAKYDFDDIVEVLLDAGAVTSEAAYGERINRDKQYKTALMIASEEGNFRTVVKLLIKSPEMKDLTDINGKTALMHAIKKPYIFNLLLNAGANIKKTTIKNETVETLAADYPIARKLLAEPDASKRKGLLPPTSRNLFDLARTDDRTFLGSGTFGAVRSVLQNGNPVALKRVVFDENDKRGNVEDISNPGMYRSEIDALSRLKGDSTVLQLVDSELHDRNAYMMTEKLNGYPLVKAIHWGKITNFNVRSIVEQLIAGLDRIHEAGVLHLDIKPDNIWFTPGANPSIKYLDFGFACSKIPCVKDYSTGTEGFVFADRHVDEGYYYDKMNDYYALTKTIDQLIPDEMQTPKNKEWFRDIISELMSRSGV
jgi:hypothetical protein